MPLSTLQKIRAAGSPGRTVGLSDDIIERFAAQKADLRLAIDDMSKAR